MYLNVILVSNENSTFYGFQMLNSLRNHAKRMKTNYYQTCQMQRLDKRLETYTWHNIVQCTWCTNVLFIAHPFHHNKYASGCITLYIYSLNEIFWILI